MAEERTTDSRIQEKRLVQTFSEIVSCNSASYQEREVADYLIRRMKDLGLSVKEDEAAARIGGNTGNLFLRIPGRGDLQGETPILITGHTDTVEPSQQKKAVIHEDGIITSDGTTVLGSDDGAALASMLEALTVLKETGASHRPVEILISACEEPYCVGAKAFDLSEIQAKDAYVFDLAGTMGRAALAAPSIYTFTAVFHGKSSHAGFAPEKGISAIKAAAAGIAQIKCGRRGNATVNIGTISGGVQDNVVPPECTVTGEIRCFDDARCDLLAQEVEDILRQASDEGHTTLDYQGIKHIKAYETPENSSVVERLRRVTEKNGLELRLEKTHGGSDGNVISQSGIRCLVVATAMNACHTCGEYTSVRDLVMAASLMLGLMTSSDQDQKGKDRT